MLTILQFITDLDDMGFRADHFDGKILQLPAGARIRKLGVSDRLHTIMLQQLVHEIVGSMSFGESVTILVRDGYGEGGSFTLKYAECGNRTEYDALTWTVSDALRLVLAEYEYEI